MMLSCKQYPSAPRWDPLVMNFIEQLKPFQKKYPELNQPQKNCCVGQITMATKQMALSNSNL